MKESGWTCGIMKLMRRRNKLEKMTKISISVHGDTNTLQCFELAVIHKKYKHGLIATKSLDVGLIADLMNISVE